MTTETAAARDQAERLLLKTLFKPTDGIVSRKLNRHISLQVTRALLKRPVTPNQMTVVAALFGLAAIVVVAIRGASGLIPGALLLLVQSILTAAMGKSVASSICDPGWANGWTSCSMMWSTWATSPQWDTRSIGRGRFPRAGSRWSA